MNAEIRFGTLVLLLAVVGCQSSGPGPDPVPVVPADEAAGEVEAVEAVEEPEEPDEPEETWDRALLDTAAGEGLCGEWEEVPQEEWGGSPAAEVLADIEFYCVVRVQTRCVEDLNGDGETDLLVRVDHVLPEVPATCEDYGDPDHDWRFETHALTVGFAGGGIFPDPVPSLEHDVVSGTTDSRSTLVAAPLLDDGRRGFVVEGEYFDPAEGKDCEERALLVVEESTAVEVLREVVCE